MMSSVVAGERGLAAHTSRISRKPLLVAAPHDQFGEQNQQASSFWFSVVGLTLNIPCLVIRHFPEALVGSGASAAATTVLISILIGNKPF
jgi:hypothetical protein